MRGGMINTARTFARPLAEFKGSTSKGEWKGEGKGRKEPKGRGKKG